MTDKEVLCKVLAVVIFGVLGLVILYQMPYTPWLSYFLISLLILNGLMILVKALYPKRFERATWMMSEWGVVLLLPLSFLLIALLASYHYMAVIHPLRVFSAQLGGILLFAAVNIAIT